MWRQSENDFLNAPAVDASGLVVGGRRSRLRALVPHNRGNGVSPLGVLSTGLFAGLLAVLGAEVSPLVPVGAVIAICIGTLAFLRPITAVYLAILLIPFETITFGSASETGSYAANVDYTNQFGQNIGLTPTEFVALAAAAGVFLKLLTDRRGFVSSPLVAPFLVLLAVHVPGLFLADNPLAVAKELTMWSAFFIVFLGVLNDRGHNTTETLALVIAAAGGLVAAIAVIQDAGSQQIASDAGGLVSNRATGSLGSPNLLSIFVVMILPLQVVFALRGRLRWQRIGGAITAAFSLLALSLALSRSSFVALAIVVVWMLVAWRPFRRLVAVLVLIAALSLATGFNPARSVVNVDVLVQRLASTASSQTQTGQKRFELWGEALSMIDDHPVFGVGADNFSAAAPRYGAVGPGGFPYQHAHSVPLTVAALFGAFGLLTFLWLAGALVTVFLRSLATAAEPHRPLMIGLAGSFLAIATDGVFDYSFSDNAFFFTVVMLAAVAARIGASTALRGTARRPLRVAPGRADSPVPA